MSALASSSSAALRPTLATPSAAPLSPSPSIRTVSSPLILPRPGSFPGAARTSVAFRAVGKNNENGSWHPSLAPHRPSPAPPLPRRSRWRRYARAHGHSLCLVPPPLFSQISMLVNPRKNGDLQKKKVSAAIVTRSTQSSRRARSRRSIEETQTRAWRVAMVSVCRGGGAGPRVV